jgi:hypothetical protein
MLYLCGNDPRETMLYELHIVGEPATLAPRVFNTLAYLVQYRAHMVTREERLDHLWPGLRLPGHAAPRMAYRVNDAHTADIWRRDPRRNWSPPPEAHGYVGQVRGDHAGRVCGLPCPAHILVAPLPDDILMKSPHNPEEILRYIVLKKGYTFAHIPGAPRSQRARHREELTQGSIWPSLTA